MTNIFEQFNSTVQKAVETLKSKEVSNQIIDFNVDAYNNTIALFDTMSNQSFTTYTKEVKKFNESLRENAKKAIEFTINQKVLKDSK